MDLPQYTVFLETPRLLLPKTLKLIGLGMLLYLAIWTNFYVLKKTLPFLVTITIMISIIILILISTILNYTKISNYQYRFFSNRIEYYGEVQQVVYYSQIQGMKIEKGLLDKLFKTGTINFGVFHIKNIPNMNQVYFYVQKMVQIYTQQPQNYGYNSQQYAQSQYAQPQQSYQQPQNYNNQNQYR